MLLMQLIATTGLWVRMGVDSVDRGCGLFFSRQILWSICLVFESH